MSGVVWLTAINQWFARRGAKQNGTVTEVRCHLWSLRLQTEIGETDVFTRGSYGFLTSIIPYIHTIQRYRAGFVVNDNGAFKENQPAMVYLVMFSVLSLIAYSVFARFRWTKLRPSCANICPRYWRGERTCSHWLVKWCATAAISILKDIPGTSFQWLYLTFCQSNPKSVYILYLKYKFCSEIILNCSHYITPPK
jgi:hypothetical protein